MKDEALTTPIEYLKGVGPARASLLKTELGIFTTGDLIRHYPFRYVDRSRLYKISELSEALQYIQVIGRLGNIRKHGGKRALRVTATLEDDSGSLQLVWFKGLKWILSSLKENSTYLVFGKPGIFNSALNIVHPEIEERRPGDLQTGPPLQPVYHATDKLNNAGLGSRAIGKLVQKALEAGEAHIQESLSQEIIARYSLLPLKDSIHNVHFPSGNDVLNRAVFRIKFDELFFLQLRLLRQRKLNRERSSGFVFDTIGSYFNGFFEKVLPFELTGAQKRVLREIRKDVRSGRQMNRLLQGDVGSGKTIVAAMTALMAIDNGYQVCIMAPTEILATQHMNNMSPLFAKVGLTTHLLTGSTKAAKRKEIHSSIADGSCQVIIGTHALLEEAVVLHKLGLVIIDEQHRFGVEQRARLWSKSKTLPHILVMTATPIPRTLAMTFYGDLDMSVLDEMPPGRKSVKTIHRTEKNRLRIYGFMEEEIRKGRQVYVVYPLIEGSEKLDLKNLDEGYEVLLNRFPRPEFQLGILHGRMKPSDKDFEMKRFVEGHCQLLVATTVIEVGVDVPNASVMVVENAERFGLSQLHQLRGRVGRGPDQSYCILMTGSKMTEESRLRIETMVRTNDGFEIAETDLRLRGPGDFHGTQQSGIPMDLKLTNLARDGQILTTARTAAGDLLERDPGLANAENAPIAAAFRRRYSGHVNWARIS